MKKHLIALALTLPFLTACGFTPMHGDAMGGTHGAFNKVRIETTDGRDAGDKKAVFYVQQRLADRIGVNANTPHVLEITPRLRRTRIGLTSDDVASRYDQKLDITYKLMDAKSGEVLDRGRVSSISTFGAPIDPYGLVSADNNATQQLAKEAADRLIIKLAGYYSDNP